MPVPTQAPAAPEREVAPFLKSLRSMLDRESAAVLRWTDDGKAFEIHDLRRMTDRVLPKYFKHAKYASFQRQLNYFNFRKWTKSKAVVCTFSNPFFVRDDPALTWRITRKRPLQSSTSSSSGSAAGSPKARQHRVVVKRAVAAEPTAKKLESEDEDALELQMDSLEWIDTLYPSLEVLLQTDEDPSSSSPFATSSSVPWMALPDCMVSL